MARSRALSCGTPATWATWPIMSRPCWHRARSRGLLARRSRLASWEATPSALITLCCLAHQLFSTLQTSTSSTSRLVRHGIRRRVGKATSLHAPWPSAHKGRECNAAHCFYDEDKAWHRGRVSTAPPAGLARTPGGSQACRVPELLDLPARHGAFRLHGG